MQDDILPDMSDMDQYLHEPEENTNTNTYFADSLNHALTVSNPRKKAKKTPQSPRRPKTPTEKVKQQGLLKIVSPYKQALNKRPPGTSLLKQRSTPPKRSTPNCKEVQITDGCVRFDARGSPIIDEAYWAERISRETLTEEEKEREGDTGLFQLISTL